MSKLQVAVVAQSLRSVWLGKAGPRATREGVYLVPITLTWLDSVLSSHMSRSFRRLLSPTQLVTFSGFDMWEPDENGTIQCMVKNIGTEITPDEGNFAVSTRVSWVPLQTGPRAEDVPPR